MKKLTLLTLLLFNTLSVIHAQSNCSGNWLSTSGNKLLDANGNEVILAGVNWFGFETSLSSFHGIWSRDMKSVLQQTKDLGFNCIRIPWHNGMLEKSATINLNAYGTDSYTGISPMNEIESTFTKPIQLLDEAIKWCQENDMKVILDNHSRNPDAYLVEALWYTENYPHEKWIEDWEFMAERYKDYDAVIGMDLNNEPHNHQPNKLTPGKDAEWGNGDITTDWALAAEQCGNAILKINPHVLIMVEGIQSYKESTYWWGGNLQGVRDYNIQLNVPNKLMYSPHEYGPGVYQQVWFEDPIFPANMEGIWEEQFNFINTQEISPLLIGELGIKTQGGVDEIWFKEFIDFIKKHELHYTFWSLNPNSGDTGGILGANGNGDWDNVVQWKMDYLKPILYDLIPNCSATSLGVSEVSKEAIGLNIYPNPATTTLHLETKTQLQKYRIYDLNGRTVLEDSLESAALHNPINIAMLGSGMYLIAIETQKGITTQAFLK